MIINTKYGNNINGDIMKRKNKIKSFLKYTIILIILGISGYYLYKIYNSIEIETEYSADKVSTSTGSTQTVENIIKNDTKIEDMLEQTTKSVCGISKLTSAGGSILSNATEEELGLGTGIVISEDGYILSNTHVTGERYSTCYVTIEDGETYTGNVVWSDTDLDLSITKIKAQDLTYANLGNSKEVKVGQTVYAIGNPIGFEFRKTITSGIISAINRTIKIEENNKNSYMSNLLQTDATINPGNSGGPLITAEGQVIGINSVKIISAEGIGFAIPINVIKPVIERFKKNNNFEEAYIGISVYDGEVAQYLNLKNVLLSGIYVSEITIGGPASNTELQVGDIIESIDEVKLNTINDLREYIFTKSPGDIITLKITRGKIKKEISINLGKK